MEWPRCEQEEQALLACRMHEDRRGKDGVIWLVDRLVERVPGLAAVASAQDPVRDRVLPHLGLAVRRDVEQAWIGRTERQIPDLAVRRQHQIERGATIRAPV